MIVDGYFLPESPFAIYAAGKQLYVPLLAGWNADEGSAQDIFGDKDATLANFGAQVRGLFAGHAKEVLKLYPAKTNEQAKRAAQELARDRGVGRAMWKWLELQMSTGGATTFRCEFDRARPLPPGSKGPNLEPRAYHSAEIEYVFSMLPHRATPWPAEDHALARLMSSYWANFAKTGDPNGPGLPQWPAYNGKDGFEVMHFNTESKASADDYRARYALPDRLSALK
jgi:para-nitrobenzyl esterase